MQQLRDVSARYGIHFLRYSLGVTFLWFGLLKLMGVSPVTEIIFEAVPSAVSGIPGFFVLLAITEIVIGSGMFFRRFAPYAAILLILHLIVATGSVLLTQGFSPSFPFLTLEGEFVVKNLVLIAAAFIITGNDEEHLSDGAIMKR